MRTTVTLDSDAEQLLRDAMQQRRQCFKEAFNQAIRAGIDPGRLNQLADELESNAFAGSPN